MKRIISLVILLILAAKVSSIGQQSIPNVIEAKRIDRPIIFDGIPSESVWQEAQHISNFTQRELNFGEPASERTEVAVTYDKNTMYIAVWCYQSNADKIIAKSMKRDFQFRGEDNFQIMISTSGDNRTGYLFVINPNGARTDIQIINGEHGNRNWNGVWDVKTTVTNEGWLAEIYIPFSTLQFKTDKVLEWAINFERNIAFKNEQSLWQGWSRDYSIYSVPNAGRLTGLHDISYAKIFEFKPFGLAAWEYQAGSGHSYPLKAGGDLNVSLSPTLKLNLTTFTDFAQVELDKIPVNLSRFSVWYPEKRQFFLEGIDLFDFYLGDRNNAFYTREIGLENGEQIPILAGARLFGKIGKNDIGFLNIQEGEAAGLPTTNNTVLRYKRSIGEQSWIGGIFTNRMNKFGSNQVFGLDAVYQTSKFLGDKNLVVSGKITTSMDDLKYNSNSLTYRIAVDYPNDLIDNFMGIGMMTEQFNPGLGFIRRKNYYSYSWYFRIMPRVLTNWGIKRLLLKPWGFTFYQTQSTGQAESFYNETRPFGAVFKSGESFEINFIQNYDRLDEPFDLSDEISIPVDKYWMFKYELQFSTFRGRRIWGAFSYNWGDFYTGKIKTFSTELGWNINRNFNISGNYTFNTLNLPEGNIETNNLDIYIDYAFTPKLNLSLFGQYNSFDELLVFNFRLHWIPKVGSDLYFIYNLGYNETLNRIQLNNPELSNAAVKLIYRFVF